MMAQTPGIRGIWGKPISDEFIYIYVTVHPGTDQITTECHGSLSVQDSREGELLLNK